MPAASVSSAAVSCSGVGLWVPQKRGSEVQMGWEHWRPEGERCSQRGKASLDSDLKKLRFILELLGGTPCFCVRDVVKRLRGSRQLVARKEKSVESHRRDAESAEIRSGSGEEWVVDGRHVGPFEAVGEPEVRPKRSPAV